MLLIKKLLVHFFIIYKADTYIELNNSYDFNIQNSYVQMFLILQMSIWLEQEPYQVLCL
jgi:hypothetical protein